MISAIQLVLNIMMNVQVQLHSQYHQNAQVQFHSGYHFELLVVSVGHFLSVIAITVKVGLHQRDHILHSQAMFVLIYPKIEMPYVAKGSENLSMTEKKEHVTPLQIFATLTASEDVHQLADVRLLSEPSSLFHDFTAVIYDTTVLNTCTVIF